MGVLQEELKKVEGNTFGMQHAMSAEIVPVNDTAKLDIRITHVQSIIKI